MGIPRLKQTLEPFAERVILGTVSPGEDNTKHENDGCSSTTATALPTTPVVIDGPALVYFIYYRLFSLKTTALASSSQGGNIFTDQQPTYHEISFSVRSFLNTLHTTHGIAIQKIYFDGGLPTSKRSVRLSRLEETRGRKLVRLRRTESRLVFGSTRGDVTLHQPSENRHYDHGSFLGSGPYSLRGIVKLVPELPFMVAGVLEDLLRYYNCKNNYSIGQNESGHGADADDPAPKDRVECDCVVEIVPGEADTWCAAHAARIGALILTSDSDFLAFDLGSSRIESASVVFLDSIELQALAMPSMDAMRSIATLRSICPTRTAGYRSESHHPPSQEHRILVGSIYHPHSLTSRLGIPADSLQRFCFHRSSDPTLSVHVLRRRCCQSSLEASSHQQREEYRAFLRRYSTKIAYSENWGDHNGHKSKSESESGLGNGAGNLAKVRWLQGLDPRLAELVTQLWNLAHGVVEEKDELEDEKVNMYLPPLIEDPDRDSAWAYGKDIRCLAYSLLLNWLPSMTEQWAEKAKVLHEYQRRGARIVGVPITFHHDMDSQRSQLQVLLNCLHQHHESRSLSAPFRLTDSHFWKSFGLAKVRKQRSLGGKVTPDPEWANRYLGPQECPYSPASWSDVHNQASVSAVLYSLRILKQTVGLMTAHNWRPDAQEHSETIKAVSRQIESLPPIAELMDADKAKIARPTEFNSDFEKANPDRN